MADAPASLAELEAFWDDLLHQYVSLKTHAEFYKSLKETLGAEPESDAEDGGAAEAAGLDLGNVSGHLEYSLGDASFLEVSKERHYEDLARDLESRIAEERLKIAELCREFDDVVTQANRQQYLVDSHDFHALEHECADVERQLNQLTSEHAQRGYLRDVQRLLEQRASSTERQIARTRESIAALEELPAAPEQPRAEKLRAIHTMFTQ